MDYPQPFVRPLFIFILIATGLLQQSCNNFQQTEPRVLVFTKTKGWQHSSIPSGIRAIQQMGRENNFVVDTTKDAALFNDRDLKRYHAVIFLSTTGNVLNAAQQAAFERYIQAGGGYVGIHSAAATEYEWPWYNRLVGAYFANHPHNPGVRKAIVNVTDKGHAATKDLPDRWERTDEWYNYRSFYPGLKFMAYLDENTYEGGMHGNKHPIAWYHEFDGGRAFYTGGGHTEENYSEPLFLKHILGGIRYAMGDGRLDYSKSYAVEVPEENRFVKTILVNDLDTPMELCISDDGLIFFTELRTGKLMLYNTATSALTLVHQFDLVTKGGTGLIGVTLDPEFRTNRFIYLYYSPPADKEPYLFNLSRFKIKTDYTLDTASEKILLQVPVQEKSGSHHGGSFAWDKDGNLYLSTGDSSSPFPANGYAPLDERPGDEFYSLDAQRSSSNTNDLKGKILRIHPEADGTYTIPPGNLFPKGTEKTRAEIYVMGCRNPYRIAVNPRTSVLYWGDIGPDAGKDSVQGPRGYDEFNQAKKAGNFGWPYFIGNNRAYAKWDFASNTAGPLFDPNAPVNRSPNNTGLQDLPPATPPIIWYPYAASEEFPELGLGGRSAMAGAFYTYDKNSSSDKKFPPYYDGALFVFDWMRNWVIALRFDENERYTHSEPFMASAGDFRRPIDLVFGKDGVMYMLEYGSVYGADNEDARLVKIEYNKGNRAPIASAGIADSAVYATLAQRVFLTSELQTLPVRKNIAGAAPLRVIFSSSGSKDLDDDDEITFEWRFDGKSAGSTAPNPTFTYTEPGVYHAILHVKDNKGLADSDTVIVTVGNEPPDVKIISTNNKSFFWNKKPFRYAVQVNDKEDGKPAPENIKVYFDYNPSPAALPVNGKYADNSSSIPYGLALINKSDCKACHTTDKVSVGPSYVTVAQRYKDRPDAVDQLARKIIEGGGGNWDKEYVMSAHPQIPVEDAKEIVKYILSLSGTDKERSALPHKGTLKFVSHKEDEPRGVYTLRASYTDRGNNGMWPIQDSETITLRNASIKTIDMDEYVGFRRFGNNITAGKHKSYFLLRNTDLTGIRKFIYEYASRNAAGEIEVRIDSYAGPVIARTPYNATGSWDTLQKVTGSVNTPVSGRHDLYFIMFKPGKTDEDIIKVTTIAFEE